VRCWRRSRAAPASACRAAAGAAPAHTPTDQPCPDPAPLPAPPPDRHRRLHPSPESFPGNRLQPDGRPQEPNRDGKSRTLVLIATMRSPTIGSPDQTQKRAHCAKKHRPRRATAPDFPACTSVPKGPRNSKLKTSSQKKPSQYCDTTLMRHPFQNELEPASDTPTTCPVRFPLQPSCCLTACTDPYIKLASACLATDRTGPFRIAVVVAREIPEQRCSFSDSPRR
jgi:hypothetical protein